MSNAGIMVPHGEDKITVELTVKEAMALTGQRFLENPQVKNDATKKLIHAIDRKLELNE
ncbi:hypothetical protein [Paenibacillus sp. 1001270B_150601_E10]|uniref:hypothetical protein n=1 Tax=Paenibacillus sp. 1001270B_150601_E10 TaxID=2787079 RepID=UPI00189FAED0|nr:hypothetical protein [Paenibacillus sp. 1001270B_150601_E10]